MLEAGDAFRTGVLQMHHIIRMGREDTEIRSRYGQRRAHKRGRRLGRYWWIVNQRITGQNVGWVERFLQIAGENAYHCGIDFHLLVLVCCSLIASPKSFCLTEKVIQDRHGSISILSILYAA